MADVEMDCDYDVFRNEKGEILFLEGKIVLQDKWTGERVLANYDEVANFFGLPQKTGPVAMETTKEHGAEVHKWSDEETHTLLGLYSENMDLVGPMRKFRVKKEMWSYIAQECTKIHAREIAAEQAEGRFKTIIKKTKAVLKNNRTSGAVRKRIPFESSMEAIIQKDDSLLPEAVISANKIVRKPALMEQPSPSAAPSTPAVPSTSAAPSIPAVPSTSAASLSSSFSSFAEASLQRSQRQVTTDTFLSAVECEDAPARKKLKCQNEKLVDKLIESRDLRAAKKEEMKMIRHEEKMKKKTNIENLLEKLIDAVTNIN